MNNEPVAWMNKIDSNLVIKAPCEERKFNWIPLYTNPVKELTDEEIIEFSWNVALTNDDAIIKFARAILRKAQEK